MCGIGGYVDFSGVTRAGETLPEMTRLLAPRGPDGKGTLVDGPCGLAHTRLAMLDHGGGAQPMAFSEQPIRLVYNGEIYNCSELRRGLRADGVSFASRSDTEVVLKGLAVQGRAFLSKLNGMFAIGAWDTLSRKLLLARDSLGEKPLYYATPNDRLLVFSSEPKAVLAHPAVDRSLDRAALQQVLRFRGIYDGSTLHTGVRELEPGSYLEFSPTGLLIGKFADLMDRVENARQRFCGPDDEELIEIGRAIFTRSVAARLVAEEPVGVFLSGGLDSSLVAATMRKIVGPEARLQTFSVGFRDDPESELPFARTVAESLRATHRPIIVEPEAYVRRLPELSRRRDGPLSEPAEVAIAEMSHVARSSVKAVLSGEGADEVFAGYPKYAFALPSPVLRMVARWASPRGVAFVARKLKFAARRAVIAARALSHSREADRLVQWFSPWDKSELRRILPGLDWTDHDWSKMVARQEDILKCCLGASPLFRMQALDCLTWLPGNILQQSDRMTMAEGLELRAPFLDMELVAFGLALPDRLKVRNNRGKWIVRQWAQGLAPEVVMNRKKSGFRVPLDVWFRGPLRPMLEGYLTAANGLCASFGDRKAVRDLIDRHADGVAGLDGALWSLLTAEVWYQDVFLAKSSAADTGRAESPDDSSLCRA